MTTNTERCCKDFDRFWVDLLDFLDAAAGEGLELEEVDAADLYESAVNMWRSTYATIIELREANARR